MKQLTKYNRAATYLDRIYNLLNEQFFESALSKPVITIQSTPLAYGHVTCSKVWKTESGESAFELNVGAGTLNRPIEEMVSTLVHEMVHIYNLENGIQDCSRGNTYHNKKFKNEAEKRGLIIEHSEKYGWTITKPSERIIDFCLINELCEIALYREDNITPRSAGGAGKSKTGKSGNKGKSSTRKYICPCCGMSIRATKQVNVMCMDCNKQLQET